MQEHLKKALAFAVAGLLLTTWAGAQEKGTPDEAKAPLDKAVKAVQKHEAKAPAASDDPKGGQQAEKREEITLVFSGGKVVRARSTDRKLALTSGGKVEACHGGGNCPNDPSKVCYYYYVGGVLRCACLTCP